MLWNGLYLVKLSQTIIKLIALRLNKSNANSQSSQWTKINKKEEKSQGEEKGNYYKRDARELMKMGILSHEKNITKG